MACTHKYKAVIFDLDGTLMDTLDDLGAAVNAALETHGFPGHTRAEYSGMVGHGVRNLVHRALPEGVSASIEDACFNAFMEYYTSHLDVYTRPYPGMVELLQELDAAGVKLAVASNKFQSGAEYLVRKYFPTVHFVAILGNAPGLPLKPDPAIVETVLKACGDEISPRASLGRDDKEGLGRDDRSVISSGAEGEVEKSKVALVGDSLTDMRTAANAGITGIAVNWGYRDMSEHSPLANTPAELHSLL